MRIFLNVMQWLRTLFKGNLVVPCSPESRQHSLAWAPGTRVAALAYLHSAFTSLGWKLEDLQ